MSTALDYSSGRPSGATVLADGHVGVIRYVGTPGRAKNITRAEYEDMTSHGVGVALVYENGSGDSGGGYSAGITAARTARADANSVGFPTSRPIYFAVDSDQVTPGQFAAVMSYLDGAASVSSLDCVGVYGEYDVIEQAVGRHAKYGWQTAAWSHGLKSGKAALYQRLGQVYVGGIECDVNDILTADWGQHNAEGSDMFTPQDFSSLMWGNVFDGPSPGGRNFAAYIKDMDAKLNGLATSLAAVTKLITDSAGHPVDAAQLATALEGKLVADLVPALTTELVKALPAEQANEIADAVRTMLAAKLGAA